MKVLVVEDDGITMFFIKESVEELGHNVVSIFDNSKDTLAYVQENEVDLMLMDINIKGKDDGITLAQKIHAKYPNISYVFISSYKDSETITNAQSVKPLGYLVKPISKKDLEAVFMVVSGLKKSTKITSDENIYYKNYKYNLKNREIYKDEEIVPLSLNEQITLHKLIKNRNSFVSREALIQTIWNDEIHRESSLRELIYRLRKKMPDIELTSTPKVGYAIKF